MLKKLMTAAVAIAALATVSIAASGDALAKGGHGGGKFFHGGGKHFGHRWHGHRFYRYGYAYNTCWKWTPYGLLNVCRVLPY